MNGLFGRDKHVYIEQEINGNSNNETKPYRADGPQEGYRASIIPPKIAGFIAGGLGYIDTWAPILGTMFGASVGLIAGPVGSAIGGVFGYVAGSNVKDRAKKMKDKISPDTKR
jgi:hypothetical protein